MKSHFLLPVLTLFTLWSVTAQAVENGSLVPELSVKTFKNYSQPEISLNKMIGKVVYVDFWASWCGPCRQSFPVLDSLHKKYNAQGFEVVGINLDEKTSDADSFLNDFPVGFPLAADPQGLSAKLFDIKGMPSGYLLDKTGVVRHIVVGFNEDEKAKLDTVISALLKE